MKRTILSILTILLCLSGYSQRFEVNTSLSLNFKRHFTHTIEGGFVDNVPRQFIAGNESDYLLYSAGAKLIQGNTINGTIFLNGKNSYFPAGDNRKFLLTDIVVPSQGGDAQQGYGCGIYYPAGENS